MLRHKIAGICIAFVLLLAPTAAFAYIDPGTGAMMVQAVLALFASVVFYFRDPRQLWCDLKKWFTRNRKL